MLAKVASQACPESYSSLQLAEAGAIESLKYRKGKSKLSYSQAAELAQRGNTDKQVLATFRKGLKEAEDEAGVNSKTALDRANNLAAALLDAANKEGDPETFIQMYRESEELSLRIQKAYPDDKAASSNLKAARQSMIYRWRHLHD
mmetsp:Transcript_36351/g.56814  ORF Transcript_36351/g.56814 Transcript_36351/m.56814 type:complete len:146 (-) Transcript_36351:249-686(-)